VEALADDVAALLQGGRDDRVEHLTPGCREQERLRGRAELHVGGQQQLADALAGRRAARLPQVQGRRTVRGGQRADEQAGLRALAAAVDPVEDDEAA